MSQDVIETPALNGGELLVAQQGLPPAESSPVYVGSHAAAPALSVSALVEQCQREIVAYRRGEPSNEAYGLELLSRAIVQGDQDAWSGVQLCFGELVRGCHLEREETYVALAFERFWQATIQQQVSFRTLGGALTYLRASLHGAILDTLRTYYRPREVSLPEPGESGQPYMEDQADGNEVWEAIQTMLSSARERRLAYLLYHCGLKPREIVRFCPQEWSDVQEIYRLRRNIFERLVRHADSIRWQLSPCEPWEHGLH